MDEKCHKTQDIDLALFLIEPHGSEWQEFRAHYPQCVTCSTELQKWTTLEQRLRSLGNFGATGHPSPETLVQFQQQPTLLPTEDRNSLALHLSACVTCREEVKLLGAFNPTRVSQWVTDTKTIVSAEVREPWGTRFWNALRPLVLHPAFAAGLVLLLSVPFIRSYYLSSFTQVPVSSDIAPTSARTPAVGGLGSLQVQGKQVDRPEDWSPSLLQEPDSMATPPVEVKPAPEAAKAKEDTRPAGLVERSAPREDLAAKDEQVAAPPPAPPAPSSATGVGRRDEAVMPQAKRRAMMEEKQQQTLPVPQKPALVEGREARSTEGPVTLQRRQDEDTSPLAGGSGTPVTTAARIQGNIVSQESQTRSALSALIATYKNAYEARDIHTLGMVWNMTPAWQAALVGLFAKSQQLTLTLTIDENNFTESADQRQVFAPLMQFVTAVNNDGQHLTHGPFYCLADLRKQNTGQWKIHDLLEDPQYPRQCRVQ